MLKPAIDIPPLTSGDRLTRREFERRYEAMPENFKAELYEQRLDWFYLHEDEYETLLAGADGITRSHAFPGLYLDAPALLAGDLARVLATLQEVLKTDDHVAFADRTRAA